MAIQKISVNTAPEKCADMLNSTQWANDFSWKQLEVLGRYFEPFSIEKGDVLFQEGDLGGTMSLLIKGRIEIQKDHKKLTALQPGRSFGEMSLIDNQCRSACAIAIENSVFISIDKDNFAQLSKEHASLALMLVMKITRLLSQRLRQTSSQLAEYIE